MFDRLTDKVSKTLKNLTGKGKITESNIAQAIAEVRLSLLEADVAYPAVQSIIDSIRKQALGEEVLLGVNPEQQFIKILHDELVRMLGTETASIPFASKPPTIIMLMGLQGTGKTTTAAKLAKYLRDEQGKMPLLVPADLSRPAAVEQLRSLGEEHGLKVFSTSKTNPIEVCTDAVEKVKKLEIAADTIIIDTAGRLAIDETLMKELLEIQKQTKPDLVLYALDAMAGQDAISVAQKFHEQVSFDGVVLTKMDGDARGGAALSVLHQTGTPICFLGMGEKVDALEKLHPERLVSRILGMGDIVTLVEKAQKAIDEKKALELSKKLRKNTFDLEDFQEQLKSVQKMGSMQDLVGFLPGGAKLKQALSGGLPEREIAKTQAIICSMTPQERRNPKLLNGSRRLRIAHGSGVTVADVNRMLKQFLQAKNMMSRMTKLGAKGMQRGGLPF
ncbi:MAG: signal recognition particle protein [Bdellovibrionales bacterium]|nr:signal recognition particle protein [Bdellovibrionales bacterium]